MAANVVQPELLHCVLNINNTKTISLKALPVLSYNEFNIFGFYSNAILNSGRLSTHNAAYEKLKCLTLAFRLNKSSCYLQHSASQGRRKRGVRFVYLCDNLVIVASALW